MWSTAEKKPACIEKVSHFITRMWLKLKTELRPAPNLKKTWTMILRDKNFLKMNPNLLPKLLFLLLVFSGTCHPSERSHPHHHQHHRNSRKLHPEHERQFLEALGLSKIPTLTKGPIEIPEVLRYPRPFELIFNSSWQSYMSISLLLSLWGSIIQLVLVLVP